MNKFLKYAPVFVLAGILLVIAIQLLELLVGPIPSYVTVFCIGFLAVWLNAIINKRSTAPRHQDPSSNKVHGKNIAE